ncbi:MAG TPA: hypothetical protein VF166_14255 [Gemmatimonadaceae bacterium]
MRHGTFRWFAVIGAGVGVLAFATPAFAQGWHYPSFTPPEVLTRELSLGVAGDGDAGTVLVGQWREGVSPATELMFDLGFASPNNASTRAVLGFGVGQQLGRANAQNPLDVLLTAGIYGGFGGGNSLVRIPVGVSIGHRFPLQGGMAITPYVHPRASLDFYSSTSDVTVNFDIGGNLELTPQVSLRASLLFSGGRTFRGDDTGFGIAVAYRPPGLRR